MDKAMREDFARLKFIRENRPKYKNELSMHKTVEATKKRFAKKTQNMAAKVAAAEQAEAAMADAVRKMVPVLEFHMAALQENPIPACNYKKAVNRFSLVNVLFDLKTKCGVKFDDESDFRRPMKEGVAASSKPPPEQTQVDDEFLKLRQQVERRDRKRKEVMRAVAAKLAKRKQVP